MKGTYSLSPFPTEFTVFRNISHVFINLIKPSNALKKKRSILLSGCIYSPDSGGGAADRHGGRKEEDG